MDSNEIKFAVNQILNERRINFEVKYIEEVENNNWTCDMWRYSFFKLSSTGFPGIIPVLDGEFFTTLGNRRAYPRGVKNPYPNPRSIAAVAWDKANIKPVKPEATDVLHSLIVNSEAASMSFNGWCSEFGYDNDSIKALRTYQQCCEVGEKLHKLFDSDALEKLHDLLSEY